VISGEKLKTASDAAITHITIHSAKQKGYLQIQTDLLWKSQTQN